MHLANAARDELRILRTKIEYDYRTRMFHAKEPKNKSNGKAQKAKGKT
jgi:hypothetical protein